MSTGSVSIIEEAGREGGAGAWARIEKDGGDGRVLCRATARNSKRRWRPSIAVFASGVS